MGRVRIWTEGRSKGAGLSRGRRLHRAEPVVLTPDGGVVKEAIAKERGLVGERFMSTAEALYWRDVLLPLERGGKIVDLARQVRVPLHAYPSGMLIGHLVVDYAYRDVATNARRYEDLKGGPEEHLYVWKKRHAKAEHGIDIQEVRYRRR